MAFVLYFFSIEVLVSYLNKVISKSGAVERSFWKDWVGSTLPDRGMQLRDRQQAVLGRAPCTLGCGESLWVRFPQPGFLLTHFPSRGKKLDV